jgi:hypothetical protein
MNSQLYYMIVQQRSAEQQRTAEQAQLARSRELAVEKQAFAATLRRRCFGIDTARIPAGITPAGESD